LAPGFDDNPVQKDTPNTATPKIDMDGDVMNIDGSGKDPVKHVSDDSSVAFCQNGARAGDLKFL
jgi:hypothetical protein